MKKTYIAPATEEINIKTQALLADSMGINDGSVDTALSKESFFDDDEDEDL